MGALAQNRQLISLIVPFMPSRSLSLARRGSYTPSSSTINVPTRPQNSSSVCQSRPLRARREASIDTTAPTRPSQIAARSFSNPGRETPEPERPRSSSITLTSAHPSCRARSTNPYWRRRLSTLLIT